VPSNFGYLLLGRVIEKVSGKSYAEYVRDDLLKPLGIRSIEPGRTLPKNRHVREPAYFDTSKGINIVQPTKKGEVPAPDGTFYLEAQDSAVGLIGSAPDYARFMQSYQPTGEPRKAGSSTSGILHGSLPGSRTLALWHGDVDIVVLFNQRSDSSGLPYDAIADLMRKTADGIKAWPK
jgi:CubicO group peptidase (beta-lactamase class C family)